MSIVVSRLRFHYNILSKLRKTIEFGRKMSSKFEYPVARKDESVKDDYFGKTISDPYRWLEDPDSEETQAFVTAQNSLSEPYLKCNGEWKQINEKLTKLWNFPKYSTPGKHGKYYYFYVNTGLQNQSVLYQQETLTSEPTVFLDPNELSADGTIALSGTSFSEDGNFFAYGLSESGSDWIKIKIRNVESGEDYPECLEKVKFSSMEWTKDNKGIFYCQYPDQTGKTDGSETKFNEHQKMYYHRVGEPQEKDVLVVEFPENPLWRMSADVTDCGKYLLLMVVKACRDNLVFFANLEETKDINGLLKITQIVHKFESDYEYITNVGSKVIFRTNKNAPNYRLICIDLNKPTEDNWTELIKEDKNDVLDWAQCVDDDKIAVCYMHDVKNLLHVHSLHSGELLRKFPIDIGTIVGFSGKKKYSEIFYQFMSYLTPGIIYHYDFSKPDVEPTVFREIKLNLSSFSSDDYVVKQIFYSSKDGTKVPMFIVHKKTEGELKPRPCLLYGYGGFNISIQPTFSVTGLMFIDSFDGILAFPNIRGGGEYGEKWHNGGRLLNKQNCFDDFQAAAEYLIDNNYTVNKQIVIQGGSNGGLLVGACVNQRPELFGGAICQVGVMDLLRFDKFTIGSAWTSDYGEPGKKEHFENLVTISPLHNVSIPQSSNKQYPATLILTADHDDRVSPLHSLKFTAALHHAVRQSTYQTNPLLLRVYSKAGHGSGKPTTKKIEEATDILAFIYKALGLKLLNVSE